jgi:ribosomal protein S4
MDKNIGKVVFLILPNIKRPQYRWIVRVPKVAVLLRNLHLKRNADYGKESLLPNGSKLWKKTKTLKEKRSLRIKQKRIYRSHDFFVPPVYSYA